jgi:hypothetical protein
VSSAGTQDEKFQRDERVGVSGAGDLKFKRNNRMRGGESRQETWDEN